jgi:hypothetical protein
VRSRGRRRLREPARIDAVFDNAGGAVQDGHRDAGDQVSEGRSRRTALPVSGVRWLDERDVSGVAKWVLLRPGS